LAAPSFCAEQERKGWGLGAKDGQALVVVVVVEEGAIGDHVFDGVVGGGYEIIRGVGCPRLPSRVTRAQGGVVHLRPEIHGVVGVEGVACGNPDSGREEATTAGRETPNDVRRWVGIVRWLARDPGWPRVMLVDVFRVPLLERLGWRYGW